MVIFVALGSLDGCTWLKAPDSISVSQNHRKALYELDAWSLTGRFGVRTVNDALQGNLDWRHFMDEERLRLSGPFGRGAVQITVKRDFIRITDSKGNSKVSHDPEKALFQRLGFAVPLTALKYWLLGLEVPGVVSRSEVDAEGKLKKLIHNGWEVQILEYMAAAGHAIPRKIRISRDDVVLKLIIDRWRSGV